VTNPATGEFVGEVPVASASEVAAAVGRARAAQPGWAALPFGRRADVLQRFHDRLFSGRDELLDTIQRETGKTRRDAFGELVAVASTARHYRAHGRSYLRERRRPGAVPLLTRSRVRHAPLGVVACITPWNYPFLLAIGDALPALLAGNAVVVKPAEATPLSAELAARWLGECGLPAHVLQLVYGPGSALGPALIAAVDYVAFTGSVATGRKVAAAAAERLIPCSLELGGKNPMIVLAGAPLEAAVGGLLVGAFYNSGQTCIGIERVYVERAIFERFVARAVEHTRALKVGWSLGWDMDMGSLISAAHADKVLAHVRDAVAKGAHVLTGGERRADLGPAFVAPTLLEGVTGEMALCAEETFGPVAALYPVADAEEAVRRANDSPYGLNASLWTGDGTRSLALARRIETGSVGLNSTLLIYDSLAVPMGGVKGSGLGRRHGRAGLLRFTQPQSIVGSLAVGGGYEGLLTGLTNEPRARRLARLLRLRRHLPGLR
jgi:acyl-CoA reductase-like NAD-dependent aldehyde dehydrogenase